MEEDPVVRALRNAVAAGHSLDEGVRQLRQLRVPDTEIYSGRKRYEEQAGLIQQLDDPPALVESQNQRGWWYLGPQSDDRCWPGLVSRLTLDPEALESVDRASTRVVSLLKPPGSQPLSGRGLVLGYVQSGKTTNFMAVAAKAADVGYRLIVVLSGITDNLRSQTQDRLDGVLVGDQRSIWYQLTTGEDDFTDPGNAVNLLSDPNKRLLAVVKKNPYRLRALAGWLAKASGHALDSCPVLVIDDEADQASLNVGRKRRSAINRAILDILRRTRSSYIAYSATPFANLLVEPNYPDGLYPRDFIVDLPPSPTYFGAARLFGRPPSEITADEDVTDGMDVLRTVPEEDLDGVRPATRADAAGWTPDLPGSLHAALDWFLLAAAARRSRTGRVDHTTMLVHTSMRIDVQTEMASAIDRWIEDLRGSGATALDRLRAQWDSESARVGPDGGAAQTSWEAVRAQLGPTLDDVRVVTDNSASVDRLSYEGDPQTAIVVGGNTLSRGLTLEGLVSSYFVRTARAYDSLLQMGRWFGYRPGYADLVRIWMPAETRGWFSDLAAVELEIRDEIKQYAEEAENVTPAQVAVRIRQHPQMQITSAAKMRDAVKVRASVDYGGTRQQTILFNHRDRGWLRDNIETTRRLLRGLDLGGRPRHPGRRVASDVPAGRVMSFLRDYHFQDNARNMKNDQLRAYIDRQREQGRLETWSVALMGASTGDRSIDLGAGPVNLITRSRVDLDQPWANIKSLVSTVDRVVDLGLEPGEISRAAGLTPDVALTDKVLRELRDRQRPDTGLLAVYPIDRVSEPGREQKPGQRRRVALDAVDDVIGVCIFFPGAPTESRAVEYWAAPLEVRPEEEEDESEELIEESDRLDEQAGERRTAELSRAR